MDKIFSLQMFADETMADNTQFATEESTVTEDTSESPVVQDNEPQEETFEDLIKGKYKKEYNEKLKETINKRFKNQKSHEDYVSKVSPLLDAISKRYGVDVNDIDGLTKALYDDNSMYEEEAFKRGIDVETLKQMKQMEAENARYKAADEARTKQEESRNEWNKLLEEAEGVKEMYPDFDLETEMLNEQFGRLVALQVPMKTAYQVCHNDEILAKGMAYAVNKTATQVVNNIKARGQRPSENGIQAQAPGTSSINVNGLTKAQYEDIRRRAESGERITFK